MYDVVVIGGGPTGSSAARLCAKAGLSTLLVEEHATIGYPVQCAGLLSNSAFAECEVSNRSVFRTVSGAKIFGNSVPPLSFDAGETKAYVVDRGMLDREMAEHAAEAGADFCLKTCVTSVNPEKHLIHTAGGEDISYRIVIAADGPRSTAARAFGVTPSPFIYSGIQAEVLYETDTPQVELYPNAAPEFFAWAIPLTENRARIGLCGTKDVPKLFSAFKKRFTDMNVHLVTGTIPIGIRKHTCGNGWMLSGDAAGFPKPTSGGGVYTGIRSARHAAATAVSALEQEDFSEKALSGYETLWKNDFGRELELGFAALKIRRTLSADDIDAGISALNNPDVLRIITEHGDMDRPSDLIKRLLRRPEILALGGRLGMKTLLRMFL